MLSAAAQVCHSQDKTDWTAQDGAKKNMMPLGKGPGQKKELMNYTVIGKDTIFTDALPAAKVYARLPKQKGKEWRKYYKLVHNFSKTYPYALAARKIVARADSTIAADKLKRTKRDKYINQVQKELLNVFEETMRSMKEIQGDMLIKLIYREVGNKSIKIIKAILIVITNIQSIRNHSMKLL